MIAHPSHCSYHPDDYIGTSTSLVHYYTNALTAQPAPLRNKQHHEYTMPVVDPLLSSRTPPNSPNPMQQSETDRQRASHPPTARTPYPRTSHHFASPTKQNTTAPCPVSDRVGPFPRLCNPPCPKAQAETTTSPARHHASRFGKPSVDVLEGLGRTPQGTQAPSGTASRRLSIAKAGIAFSNRGTMPAGGGKGLMTNVPPGEKAINTHKANHASANPQLAKGRYGARTLGTDAASARRRARHHHHHHHHHQSVRRERLRVPTPEQKTTTTRRTRRPHFPIRHRHLGARTPIVPEVVPKAAKSWNV
ncbi:hypothetical protein B0J12DRAFT_458715 [Macrophomina phaseolina]|uniref:Uncharacterized protein n=1 Tax=Macrophomina phaseolina TaxID=35725 RepID=A0ABQ8GG43_9PEZI|nr:hypothetical protein B0J12DRAFT_458715 [Macrophomina phaseolina]